MAANRMRPRKAVAGLALALMTLVALASPAAAADFGDWQFGFVGNPANCRNRGAGVMYEGDYNTNGVRCMSSSLRDSSFVGDLYGNLSNHKLNDRVLNFRNDFTTLKLRAYHDSNYVTGSTCIGGQIVIGPYPFGVSSGLSSFKSC